MPRPDRDPDQESAQVRELLYGLYSWRWGFNERHRLLPELILEV
jgi:hypothetical protein